MQLRQRPQTTWPSPLTRSPGWNPVTFEPTSTTSPTNSCPITSGTGIVRCAQASQRWMWTSVPQMPVLETRINTSLIPISGSGTSSSQRPGSARLLTSAFTARAGDSRCPGGESYAGASRPGRNGASRRREVLLRRPRTVEQPDQHRRERGCEERRQDRARRPDEDVDQGDDPAGHGERAEHHARNATPTEERVRRDGEERGEDERTDSPGLGHVVPADEPDDPHEAEERRLREAEERRKHDDERQLLTRSLHVLLLASGGGVGSSHDSSRGTRLHEHTPRPGGPGSILATAQSGIGLCAPARKLDVDNGENVSTSRSRKLAEPVDRTSGAHALEATSGGGAGSNGRCRRQSPLQSGRFLFHVAARVWARSRLPVLRAHLSTAMSRR